MSNSINSDVGRDPWNKGRLIGQKRPLSQKEVWGIRMVLKSRGDARGLALFNLALDSKLRACDLIKLRVTDVMNGSQVMSRATVVQQKTGSRVQFEITGEARDAILTWIKSPKLVGQKFLFPSKARPGKHLSPRQYARLVEGWVRSIGLETLDYGTHSLRRTKATLIYRRTKNLRAIQLLLGHSKMESTVRYLGIEIEDALAISEQVEL